MSSSLNLLSYNRISVFWKQVPINRVEVMCFTNIGVINQYALDIRLCSQNGDVLIVQRGGGTSICIS